MKQNQYFGYFIAGTDTGVGKTLVASALLHLLTQTGVQTAGIKPVATGAIKEKNGWLHADVEILRAQASRRLPVEIVAPYIFQAATAPHIAAALESREICFENIVENIAKTFRLASAVVIEGIGGCCVPLTAQKDTTDLMQILFTQYAIPAILVVGQRLGCINHALLSLEILKARQIPVLAWVANTIDPEMLYADEIFMYLNEKLLTTYGLPCLGRIPYVDAPALAARVVQAARALHVVQLPHWPAAQAL